MHGNNVVVGTVEGTGAAINIELGFIPKYVKVFNYDDAGSLFCTLEWWSGMAAASGLKTSSIVDDGTTTLKSSEKITSLGISEYAGSAGANSEGFTIGAETDVNVSAETMFYMAIR
jgi:hypothetical protein